MESCAIALSSSTLNLRTLSRNLISPYYGLRRSHHEQQLPQPWPLQYSTPGHNNVTAAATRRSTSTLLPAAPPLCSAFSKPIPISLRLFTSKSIHDDDGDKVVVRASSSSSESGPAESSINSEASSLSKPNKLGQTLQLAIMFGLWYLLNIYFNIFNKQVLKVFPYPTTVTAFQFGCGTVMILIMWAFNLHPKPKLRKSQVRPILLLAVAHTMGNLLTNISLGKVAVSFTHTIKAMEPFFTVIFSILFLAEWPTIWVVSSLVPIVGGVALASFTEASFNWIGFSSAMASNLTNQSRNVLSKKFMVRKEDALDNINLFSIITIIAFILLIPFAIYMDGIKFSPSFLQSAASEGLNVKELCVRSLLAGFCFHSYQQVSYMILQMVSPVTHAVGNCVKRVVVIVSAVLFFRTPVSPINSLGTALALAGVFLYSRAKRIKPKVT